MYELYIINECHNRETGTHKRKRQHGSQAAQSVAGCNREGAQANSDTLKLSR